MESNNKRIIGIDPGLRFTGWGIVDIKDNKRIHIANGTISTDSKLELAPRLYTLSNELSAVVQTYSPNDSAIEKTFVNKNPLSSLKLGHARGALIVTLSQHNLLPEEYDATKIKKAITGNGRADKNQISAMVSILLPAVKIDSSDSADALAIALCHANYCETNALYDLRQYN